MVTLSAIQMSNSVPLLCSHFSTMNLTMVGKTLPVLISQVQEFIFDYNLERSINSTLNSQTTEGGSEHEVNWNFPGLRKRRVVQQKEGSNRSRGGPQQPGIAEIVLLQQRTVLQVSRNALCMVYKGHWIFFIFAHSEHTNRQL